MGEKNPWTKNLTPNKSHNKFTSLKNLQKGKQDWLYLNRSTMWPGYVGTSMNLQIVLNAQKILTKFSYPKKFLRSSPSLEIWSAPPLGVPACIDDSLQSSSHETIDSNFPLSVLLLSSLRKRLTFGNATTGFPTINDVWEMSPKIPYWWHITTLIRVVLLIGHAAWEIWFNQSEALPRSG